MKNHQAAAGSRRNRQHQRSSSINNIENQLSVSSVMKAASAEIMAAA